MGVQPWVSGEINISKKNNRIDIGRIELQNKFIEAASVDIKEKKEISNVKMFMPILSLNSKNIINLIKHSKQNGSKTFGLLGFDGGQAKEIVDFPILINSKNSSTTSLNFFCFDKKSSL